MKRFRIWNTSTSDHRTMDCNYRLQIRTVCMQTLHNGWLKCPPCTRCSACTLLVSGVRKRGISVQARMFVWSFLLLFWSIEFVSKIWLSFSGTFCISYTHVCERKQERLAALGLFCSRSTYNSLKLNVSSSDTANNKVNWKWKFSRC
jgi:hypothetical protein